MEKKIEKIIKENKPEAFFMFLVPQLKRPIKTKREIILTSYGMCGHDMLMLSKKIKEIGQTLLKEEKKN